MTLGPQHKTSEYLTKFEFARVLGLRVFQIIDGNMTREAPFDIAISEILEGRNEMVVRRRMSDGTYEDRRVSELKLPTHIKRLCASDAYQAIA